MKVSVKAKVKIPDDKVGDKALKIEPSVKISKVDVPNTSGKNKKPKGRKPNEKAKKDK